MDDQNNDLINDLNNVLIFIPPTSAKGHISVPVHSSNIQYIRAVDGMGRTRLHELVSHSATKLVSKSALKSVTTKKTLCWLGLKMGIKSGQLVDLISESLAMADSPDSSILTRFQEVFVCIEIWN